MASDTQREQRPQARPGARDATPAGELQPPPTGPAAGGGTPAEAAMKQTSKTPQETGSGRTGA